jgi:hypothetical protein
MKPIDMYKKTRPINQYTHVFFTTTWVGYDVVVVVVVASHLTQSCIHNVFVATGRGGGSRVAGRAGSGCGGVGQVEELGFSLGCTTNTAASPPTPWPALGAGRLANANAHGAAVLRLYDSCLNMFSIVLYIVYIYCLDSF